MQGTKVNATQPTQRSIGSSQAFIRHQAQPLLLAPTAASILSSLRSFSFVFVIYAFFFSLKENSKCQVSTSVIIPIKNVISRWWIQKGT